MRVFVLILLASVLGTATAAAEGLAEKQARNWHQWRGPEATGTAPQADPPTEWDATKNVKWRVEVPGKGSSTPIVWEDRVYVMTAVKTERVKEDATDSKETTQAAPAAEQVTGRRW